MNHAPDTIDLAGLDLPSVLAALYNSSHPQGWGFAQYTPEDMTREQADEILSAAGPQPYFDYLGGRVMKIDLSGPTLNPAMYDRDNGDGAAARAINRLRAEAAA